MKDRGQALLILLAFVALVLAGACALIGPSPQQISNQTAIAGIQASLTALSAQQTSTQAALVTAHAQQTLAAQATGTAQANLTATSQGYITATAQAALSAADVPANWKLALYDSFDDNSNKWPEGHDRGNQWADVESSVSGGGYVWKAKSRQAFGQWVTPGGSPVAADCYVSAKVSTDSPEELGASYGLIIRADIKENSFYSFEVNEGGPYAIVVQTKGVADVIQSGSTTALVKGGNTLAVRAIGPRLTFFVNGTQVAEVSDNRIARGTAGVTIGLSHRAAEVTFTFDDFTVLTP